MFLAKYNSSRGPVIGIGLRTSDLEQIAAGRPASFALRDAGIYGPEADERVLLHFATPIQIEQIRHGYFVGLTDARVLLFIDGPQAAQLQRGEPIDVQIQGAPVNRFVIFVGSDPGDATQALQRVGVLDRSAPAFPSDAGRPRTWRYRFQVSPLSGSNAAGAIALT